jgi:5-oxoprolinase (ATP-hydrolysing)
MADAKLQIAIDRGGTFTDALGRVPGSKKEDYVIKLSHDPNNYKDAPREAVRRIIELHRGTKIGREEKIETNDVEYIRLSTTVATNALLERKGEKHALITTKGFKDVVQIGNQSRPRIFDLAIRKPDVLYSSVVEVDERVTLVGYTSDPKADQNRIQFGEGGAVQQAYKGEDGPPLAHNGKEAKIVQGVSGEAVAILKEPDREKVQGDLKKLYDQGFRALAIVLMHSYTYPEHERIVEEIAKDIGFTHISVSSSLMPMIKVSLLRWNMRICPDLHTSSS